MLTLTATELRLVGEYIGFNNPDGISLQLWRSEMGGPQFRVPGSVHLSRTLTHGMHKIVKRARAMRPEYGQRTFEMLDDGSRLYWRFEPEIDDRRILRLWISTNGKPQTW